ncbi:MAG: YfhO family protein [bacterium]
MNKIFKNKYFLSGLVLVIFLLIFFYQPNFYNRTLVPLDILQEFDSVYKVQDFQSHNFLLSDIVDQFYPNNYFLKESLSQGEIPFWNPHILMGTPFLADSQTGIFEFTHLLSYIFEISALNLPLFSALILLFILGFSFLLYLRNLKISWLVSIFGAVVLMFSGTIIVWLDYPLVAAFVWLPLLLFCIDKIAVVKNLRFLPLLAIVICISFLAGYPQIAVLNLALSGIYFLLRAWQKNLFKTKIFSLTLIFLLLGVALSAWQTGPSWDFIQQSQAGETGRGSAITNSFTEEASGQFNNLKSTFKNGWERTKDFAGLAFSPKHFGSPVERDYRDPGNDRFANFSEVAIYSGLFTILLAITSLIWIRKKQIILFWLTIIIVSFSLFANLPFLNLLKYLPMLNKISLNRLRLYFVLAIVMLAVYALQKIYLFLKKTKASAAQVIVVCLIILSFANLFYFYHDYNLGNEKETAIFSNPAVQFLQDNTEYERVTGLSLPDQGFRSPLIPNTSTLFNLYDIRGYNPIKNKEFTNFADANLSASGSFTLTDNKVSSETLSQLSVKYAVCAPDVCNLAENNWQEVYADENVKIWENPEFYPRAYLADANLKPIKKADILEYSANKVLVRAETDNSELLVLTDAYDDGWQALVNNEKVEVERVGDVFRGVQVPEGVSEIEFSYLPSHFYWYLGISFGSLLALLVLSWWFCFRCKIDKK